MHVGHDECRRSSCISERGSVSIKVVDRDRCDAVVDFSELSRIACIGTVLTECKSDRLVKLTALQLYRRLLVCDACIGLIECDRNRTGAFFPYCL